MVLTDLDQARVDKGCRLCHAEIDKLVAKGRLDEGKAAKLRGLVSGSVDKAAFADADFVIEAVFEELAVKKQVWAELEKIVTPDCVLATNTSSLSVTEMAADLEHPERVVGFHFFNPVAVMPLLEIVRGERTDDATLATAFAVGKELKKSRCWSRTRPAFVVNRLLPASWARSAPRSTRAPRSTVADAALDPLGLPMRRSCCSSWSGRPSRCTSARACTPPSRTGSRSQRQPARDRRGRASGRFTLVADGETYSRRGPGAARRSATGRSPRSRSATAL